VTTPLSASTSKVSSSSRSTPYGIAGLALTAAVLIAACSTSEPRPKAYAATY
jgi:hypothetical protein